MMIADRGCIKSQDISLIYYLRRTMPEKRVVANNGMVDVREKTKMEMLLEKMKGEGK